MSAGGVDRTKIAKLLERARRDVDEGLLPSVQIALAYRGELVVEQTYGLGNSDIRYCIFSATKPLVASTVWTLIADGSLDVGAPVADYFPEFGAHGKDRVTVEQVMIHTAGFPLAALSPSIWGSRQDRRTQMASWRLSWEPGTRFEYHPLSAHWVLAELIELVTGRDYRDVVQQRVTSPVGLPRILGLPDTHHDGIADLVLLGDPATTDDLQATFGIRQLPDVGVTDELLLRFNDPSVREIGVPGAGGLARACDLAVFYQELLHNRAGIWDPVMLSDSTARVRNTFPDLFGVSANYTLGLVLAGDDGRGDLRAGMGTRVSPRAFGHSGAGGQLAWADPETGLSLGYVTNGFDRHEARLYRRQAEISNLAAECGYQ